MGIFDLRYLLESEDKSKLDKKFTPKQPMDYYIIDIHSNDAKKYYDKISESNFKYFNSHMVGKILLDKSNDNFIGYVIVIKNWRYPSDSGKEYGGNAINPIEVSKKYRGYGFGNILLNIAIKQFNANVLRVYKDNEIAIRMYIKAGFKTVDTHENGEVLIMTRKG